MPDEYRPLQDGAGGLKRQFKQIGTDPISGEPVFAEVLALETGSIGGGGADPTYQEDTASTAAEKVIMAGVVRKDAAGSLVDTDGDRTELQVDSSGALRVTSGAGGGSGTEYTEDAASAADPIGRQLIARRRDTLAVETSADGDVTALNSTGKGELYVKQTDAVPVTDNGGSLTVDGPLTDTQLRAAAVPVSGPLTDTQLRASAVPVGDGGSSLTVDGSVSISGGVDTELEAAAALADASGNPTTPRVGAAGLVWNGTGWDRMRGDTTNGLDVDVTRVQGTVTVAGTVTANAGSGPFPISDGGNVISVDDGAGSLTVDGTVGISGTVDTSDRAAREVGRVRIWDGTDEATVIPLRTQPATTEKAIPIFDIPNRLATYSTVTAEIAPAITVGVKELLAIWAGSAGTKDKYIVEIWITALVTTASTAGRTTCRVSTITSAPTGGTELTKVDIGGAGASDMTNTMAAKTGGGALGNTFIRREVWHATQAVGSRVSEALFQAANPGAGIILRAGANSGISIDCERAVAHTALVDQWTVGIRWLEI